MTAAGRDPLRLLTVTEAATAPAPERRWISVAEFAAYIGVSERQVRRMIVSDPDVRSITKKVGKRVLVCVWAWRERVERRMADPAEVA